MFVGHMDLRWFVEYVGSRERERERKSERERKREREKGRERERRGECAPVNEAGFRLHH